MPYKFKGQNAYLYRPSETRRPSGLNTIRQSPSPVRVSPVNSRKSPSPTKYKKTQKGRFTVYSPKNKSPSPIYSKKQKGRFTVYKKIEPVKIGRFIVYYRRS
jgi:hypothetical protein